MKHDPSIVSDQLTNLFERLIGQPKMRRGSDWKDKWDGWDGDKWQSSCCGVYVLWRNEDDLEKGNRPLYIGEGISGTRIWESFQRRADWHFAQILYDDKLTSVAEGMDWRRLLERFAIVVLDPEQNAG